MSERRRVPDMDITMGRRIKYARRKRCLTLEKLSEVSGLSIGAISGYENDKRDPRLFNMICLADALGVSLDWLTGRKKGMGVDDA